MGDGRTTARSVRIAFDRTGPVSTGGATPPLGWQTGALLAGAETPRAVDIQVTFQVVRSGELTPQRAGSTDVRPALPTTER